MQYRSEKDILDAYGWGLITEKQYDRYLALFREGEDHAPTDVSKGPEGRNTSWDHVQLGWNGDTEYYAHVNMVVDETNLYEYVGAVDYVFVGTVEEIVKNIVPDEPGSSDADLSVYKIRVDENLKGELTENIECSKHGGFKKDGTMMLIFSDRSKDTGLPESGNQYIFLAYAQPDGSLTLSEFFDNRQYSEDLFQEYLDYCSNEVSFDRTRFVSSYDKSQANS